MITFTHALIYLVMLGVVTMLLAHWIDVSSLNEHQRHLAYIVLLAALFAVLSALNYATAAPAPPLG